MHVSGEAFPVRHDDSKMDFVDTAQRVLCVRVKFLRHNIFCVQQFYIR